MKNNADKEKLLEALKENHIIYAACRKVGVSKSTYYRFRESDPEFAAAADAALQEGIELVNDAAESNIVTEIKNRDKDASKFWLKHRHPAYSTKIHVETSKHDPDITPEQEALLQKAIKLAGLDESEDQTQAPGNNHDKQTDNSGTKSV